MRAQKGGSDADFSNRALVRIIHSVLERQGINPAVCTLLPPDREATAELLGAVGLVDLIIPRGSSSLIHFVREHAKVSGDRDWGWYLSYLFLIAPEIKARDVRS